MNSVPVANSADSSHVASADVSVDKAVSPQRIEPAKRRWITALHLLCIAAFATFLCWGLRGHVPLNGDDMRVLHRIMLKRTNLQYNYLAWTRSRMHTVALLYDEYKLAGDSMERANLIWLGIYVASAFAAYAYLRKVFSPVVALTGAVVYLSYSSKFEPLTWWSAGAYTLIWLAFFGMMNAMEGKLSFRVKSIVISTIIFFSMYIYEVFTCLVPFISMILLARRKREVGRLTRRDWFYACLPTIVLLVHIGTLASARNPIFLFETSTIGKAPIEQRIAAGFTTALDATIGPKHLKDVKNASHSYKDHYRKDSPALDAVLWVAIGLFAAAALCSVRWSLTAAPSVVAVGETALLGAVALFVSAFIGFVSNLCVTPSRLTGVPSIGLMLLLCAGLELLISLTRRSSGIKQAGFAFVSLAALVTIFAYNVREVEAFHSMLTQAGEVNEFDLKIANQIKAMHPIVNQGDEIYVRMPRAKDEVLGRWQNFWSGFNSGRANETFWYLYDLDPGVINFNCTPCKSPGEDIRMKSIVDGWNKIGVNHVYPFYVDENEVAYPIKTLVLTDTKGIELKVLDFSSRFSKDDLGRAVTQSIPVAE